jgi:hypothetical protein
MDLPQNPGRARMLAYGAHVRLRNHQRHFQSTHQRRSRRLDYDTLVNLPDVPVGLTILELINCSKVYVCGRHVFCCICQDSIQTNDILRRLKCNHEYHINCIYRWFVNKNKCPLCIEGMKN